VFHFYIASRKDEWRVIQTIRSFGVFHVSLAALALMAAMSIFLIVIIASKARFASPHQRKRIGSRARGDLPGEAQRSCTTHWLSMPHCEIGSQ